VYFYFKLNNTPQFHIQNYSLSNVVDCSYETCQKYLLVIVLPFFMWSTSWLILDFSGPYTEWMWIVLWNRNPESEIWAGSVAILHSNICVIIDTILRTRWWSACLVIVVAFKINWIQQLYRLTDTRYLPRKREGKGRFIQYYEASLFLISCIYTISYLPLYSGNVLVFFKKKMLFYWRSAFLGISPFVKFTVYELAAVE